MKFLAGHWIDVLFVTMILLSAVTHNKSLCISLCVVLGLRWLRALPVLEVIAGNGINWAIILLTVGFLSPLALERYSLQELREVFVSPAGWVAIAVGILVAIFGSKGVAVGQTDIVITMGVVMGTFFGVAFFKGNPVGPLIGTGMAYFAIALLRRIFPF